MEEVVFIDIAASMKNIIEASSLMKKVELILDLNYDERYVLCDETQIRQAILNICFSYFSYAPRTVYYDILKK